MKKIGLLILGFMLLISPTFESTEAAGGGSANDGTTYELEGLENPVEILVDEWGIPHIYADSTEDVYFSQGFNAARDRLWQIDLWRKNGLGELSEVFGSEYLEQDRAKRLFLYRGDMEDEWLAYGPETEAITTSFTDGINAYIKMTEENPDLLPEEIGRAHV